MSDTRTSNERVLPTTDLEWIAHVLKDADAALAVLFTMLAKVGLRDGAMVADEIAANVKTARKLCGHLSASALEPCERCGKPLPPLSQWSMPACPACVEAASAQPPPAELPPELFDGHAVLQQLAPWHRARTSPENVSDVLAALVTLIRKRQRASVTKSGDAP
jgi:hypothetical protein